MQLILTTINNPFHRNCIYRGLKVKRLGVNQSQGIMAVLPMLLKKMHLFCYMSSLTQLQDLKHLKMEFIQMFLKLESSSSFTSITIFFCL